MEEYASNMKPVVGGMLHARHAWGQEVGAVLTCNALYRVKGLAISGFVAVDPCSR
jgi:hypothetical protein